MCDKRVFQHFSLQYKIYTKKISTNFEKKNIEKKFVKNRKENLEKKCICGVSLEGNSPLIFSCEVSFQFHCSCYANLLSVFTFTYTKSLNLSGFGVSLFVDV